MPSADFGFVGGPVSGGGPLPFDSDGDVDAEGAGEDYCGQLGGELERRGRAGFGGPDAEFAEPFTPLRSSMSRSPTARGAGDRPSVRTAGRIARALAR